MTIKHEVEFRSDLISFSMKTPISDWAFAPHTFPDDSCSSKTPMVRHQTSLEDCSTVFSHISNMAGILL